MNICFNSLHNDIFFMFLDSNSSWYKKYIFGGKAIFLGSRKGGVTQRGVGHGDSFFKQLYRVRTHGQNKARLVIYLFILLRHRKYLAVPLQDFNFDFSKLRRPKPKPKPNGSCREHRSPRARFHRYSRKRRGCNPCEPQLQWPNHRRWSDSKPLPPQTTCR